MRLIIDTEFHRMFPYRSTKRLVRKTLAIVMRIETEGGLTTPQILEAMDRQIIVPAGVAEVASTTLWPVALDVYEREIATCIVGLGSRFLDPDFGYCYPAVLTDQQDLRVSAVRTIVGNGTPQKWPRKSAFLAFPAGWKKHDLFDEQDMIHSTAA